MGALYVLCVRQNLPCCLLLLGIEKAGLVQGSGLLGADAALLAINRAVNTVAQTLFLMTSHLVQLRKVLHFV